MTVPVGKLSRLLLKEMPPTTRSGTRAPSRAASPSYQDDQDSWSSDTDSDCDDGSVFDATGRPTIVRSPARLLYSLEQLSDIRQAAVRDVFREPPKIALQRCRRIGNTYAFQMTELVTRSVRIRAPENAGASPHLSCSCGRDDDAPCSHLLWLLDQLLKQTTYNHDGTKPFIMNKHGYAQEMRDPFQTISDFHLDILANALHCPVVNPTSYHEDGDEIDRHRVLEARELLASVYSTTPEDFRPDIFTNLTMDDHIIRRSDLDSTVVRMLLDNHHFFQYFLSLSSRKDFVNDFFRKLSQRVDHVLRKFDAFTQPSDSSTPTNNVPQLDTGDISNASDPSNKSNPSDQTTPADASWAAKHLIGIVGLIRSSIYIRDLPLQPSEAISAARTLVQILAAVVARNCDTSSGQSRCDRNLYLRLIGDQGDSGFVIAELGLLPGAASHLVDRLEEILEQIGLHGAPTAYVAKFQNLVRRLRTSSTGTDLKRHIAGQEGQRDSKRMK